MSRLIGIYPGSFNPFHIGHFDIVKKAEAICDVIIIARGINPEKSTPTFPLPPSISRNYDIENYDGLLTDFMMTMESMFPNDNLVLIRGMRNAEDAKSELTQLRYLEDMYPNIKVMYIFGDRNFSHISSSAIRSLRKLDADISDYVL